MEKVFATPMTGEGRARLAEAVNARARDITWFPFGRSILGTSLLCAKRGTGTPVLLFVGAHHGMEHITGNLLYAFLAERELPRGTYYVVPCLNPDGVELELTGALSPLLAERQLRMNGGSRDFSRWQANARGVDLNHNYPTGFDAYRSIERSFGITGGAPTRYSGEYPLSEPETQALMGLIEILNPDAVLTLHTQGREIFFGADPCRRAHACAQPPRRPPKAASRPCPRYAPAPPRRIPCRLAERGGGIRGADGYARGEGSARAYGRVRVRHESSAALSSALSLAGSLAAPPPCRRLP